MRKVYVEAKVRLIISANDDVVIDNVIDEMNCNFVSQNVGADIEDVEITDWHVEDSK